MRHLRSILYAFVLAPAVWVLSGVGFTNQLAGRARDNGGVESLSGLLLLLLAGAAYAILIFAPISPAGPTLFGLVFFGVTLWGWVAPRSYAGVWPPGVSKAGFDLSRPGYGLAALLAVPLVCTALSARRWERYEPPQIPLIGTLGRPSGAAAVAGTPIAAVTTQIVTVVGAGAESASAARTEVIELPGAVSPGEPTDETPDQPTDDATPDQPADDAAPGGGHAGESAADEPAGGPAAATTAAAPGGGQGEITTVIAQPWSDRTERLSPPPAGSRDDEDRTQVIKLPVDNLPTRNLAAGERPTRSIDHGGATQVIGPDQRTQVIARDPGVDPTTRLVPPNQPGQDTRPGEATTVDVGDGDRALTVLDHERPADEAADDTRRLGVPPVPAQRRADDETTRL